MLRRVKTIDMIYDMTIAADPAYEETTVAAREAYNQFTKPNEAAPPVPNPLCWQTTEIRLQIFCILSIGCLLVLPTVIK